MKKLVLLLSLVLSFSVVSCKKKKSESAAAAGKSAEKAGATVEKELGFKPKVSVTVNMASLRKTSIYAKYKSMIEKGIGKDIPCAKDLMTSIENMVILGDVSTKGGNSKDVKSLVMISGLDYDAAIKCMKSSKKAKMVAAKLNGKDVFLMDTEKGKSVYIFKGNGKSIVMISKSLSAKVTPGKGTIGKGDISGFTNSKSMTFNIKDIEELNSAVGFINVGSGFELGINADFKDTKNLDKGYAQYEAAKKDPSKIPLPGLADMLKNIKVSKKGSKLEVTAKFSEKEVEKIMSLAMMAIMR
jgi:hypothetical protein